MKTLSIPLELTEQEAEDFAQFLKRATFSDYREKAESEAIAYRMQGVGEKVRQALADQGFSPR
jgi:hypothetical protein